MKFQKIVLDRNIYCDDEHTDNTFDTRNISSMLGQMAVQSEWRHFPNKESVLLCDDPVVLSGRTIIKAFYSKEFNGFTSWLDRFYKKNSAMIMISDSEFFHPRHIEVLKQIDNFGKPCRILSPWRYGKFKNIKEYSHDLNACSLLPSDFTPCDKDYDHNFFSMCRTSIKPDRPGRLELIKNLEASDRQSDVFDLDYHTAMEAGDHEKYIQLRKQRGFELKIPFDVYERCHLEIVCETNTTVPEVFYPTEKIYKPLCGEMPFVVLAAKGFLTGLRNKGFMTFGDIFDEGYDEIDDLDDRIKAICDLLKDVQNKDLKRLCRHITRHNRRKFYEIYSSGLVLYTKKIRKIIKYLVHGK